MPLVTFYQIFTVVDDKTLEFIHDTKIGGIEFNAGEKINKGIVIGGIDFFKYLGNEMEVTVEDNDTYVIDKVYV